MRLKDLERHPIDWRGIVKVWLKTIIVSLLVLLAYSAGRRDIAGLSMRGIDNAEFYHDMLEQCRDQMERTLNMVWLEDASFHNMMESMEALPINEVDK